MKYYTFFIFSFFFLTAPLLSFAGSSDNLSGWAWSETIGWISFNCTNSGTCGASDYGVNVSPNGDLSGFAWTETIGWISFNIGDTQNCLQAPCQAKLNKTQGTLGGWAKAIAADGNGWDGWIHLSGTNYGVTVSGCNYDGYAWGSDVIGWIHLKGSNYGVVGTEKACTGASADIKANGSDNPITIPYNTSATITWISSNADSCSVSPTGWTGTSGFQSTGSLTASQIYTLNCTGQGAASDSVTINVFIPPLSASCSVAPTEAKAGQTVVWSASASGGIGSYSLEWNGSPNPNPLDKKIGNPVYVSYTTLGTQSGSVTVTSGDQTLNASCSNSVNIVPGILSFTANPSKITFGQSSKLDWVSTGFTSCSIDQGIGAIALNGSRIVTPEVTTTYTLSCIGSSDSKSVIVTVLQEPEFIEIYPQEILSK